MGCVVANRHRDLCISVNRYLNARIHETIGAGPIKTVRAHRSKEKKDITFVMKGTKHETLFRLPNSMTEAILLMRMQGYGGTDWKNTSRHLCTDGRALSISTVYLTVSCLWPASPHFVNSVESLPSLVLLTSVLCPSSALQPFHTKFFNPQILSILLFFQPQIRISS